MQRHYFKYRFGYINIDDENLYMTNSGNWQEARETEEKSRANQAQNAIRVNRMKGFVYTILGGGAIFFIKMISNIIVAVSIFAIAAFVVYMLFQYFTPEFGARYRIPLSKIISIEIIDKEGFKIFFLYANDEPDFEFIEKPESKGLIILESRHLIANM